VGNWFELHSPCREAGLDPLDGVGVKPSGGGEKIPDTRSIGHQGGGGLRFGTEKKSPSLFALPLSCL
jgi:hypothetical protein